MATSFVRYTTQRSAYREPPFTLSAPGVRVILTATEVPGARDLGIFCYKVVPRENGQSIAEFSHVCSVVDMEDYPLNVAYESDYFRLSTADLVYPTHAEVDDLLVDIEGDFKVLLEGIEALDQLGAPVEVVYPSGDTATRPGGQTVGNGGTTQRIDFPVQLSYAPATVMVAATPPIPLKVTAVDTAGFDIASSVVIATNSTIFWQVP